MFFKNTATHTSNDEKTSVTLKWKAPESYNGPVVFV